MNNQLHIGARAARLIACVQSWCAGLDARLVLLALVVFLPLFAVFTLSLYQLTQRDEEDARQNALQLARTVSSRIDAHITHVDTVLLSIQNILEPVYGNWPQAETKLRAFEDELPAYLRGITVYSPGGELLASTFPVDVKRAYQFLDRSHIKRAIEQGESVMSDPIISRITGEWVVVAVRPILNADGTVKALVGIRTRLMHFREAVFPREALPGTMLGVVTRDGIVVVRSLKPMEWIGKQVPLTAPVADAMRQRTGTGRWRGADEIDRVWGYVRASATPWHVFVGVDVQEALATSKKLIATVLIEGAVGALIAALLALWFAAKIRTPIAQLSRQVERFAQGDLQARSEPAGPAEIRRLASDFNTLAQARQQVEHSLRESLLQLRLTIDASEVGLWDWDFETNQVQFSPEWKRQLGYEPHELSDTLSTWETRVHPEDKPATLERVNRFRREGGKDYEVEFRMRHKDGGYRWILTRAALVRDETGAPVRMMGCHIDITRRKDMELAVKLNLERVRELTKKVRDTQEGERRRIGRELHDHIGASLAALNISLGLARAALPDGGGATLRDMLTDAQEQVSAITNELRRLVDELRPALLEEYGLISALRHYAAPLAQRTGVCINVLGSGELSSISTEVQTALFRVAQGAVANALRHSLSDTVEIEVTSASHYVRMSVQDFGQGYDTSAAPGNGTQIMQERVSAVGGTLFVESFPGDGTTVTAYIPRPVAA